VNSGSKRTREHRSRCRRELSIGQAPPCFLSRQVVGSTASNLGIQGGANRAPENTNATSGALPVWRRRVWLPAVKASGCAGAGFHDLRRINATALVVGGVDVKTAQVRLGHSDPRMTLAIHASAPASADRAAADVLGATFFGTSTEQ
jgi:integrase